MNSIISITDDAENVEDFYDTLTQLMDEIDQLVTDINKGRDISECVGYFLNLTDVLKNKAYGCNMGVFLELVTHLERVFEHCRITGNEYNVRFFEAIVMIMDRLFSLANDAALYKQIHTNLVEEAKEAIKPLLYAKPENFNDSIERSISVLSGGFNESSHLQEALAEFEKTTSYDMDSNGAEPPNLDEDMKFFRELAIEVDGIHPDWSGRTDFLMPIALGMNALAGNPVNYFQLQAAIYLHDVGMRFMPEGLLRKKGGYTAAEREQLASHPNWAIDNISLMEGWNDAAWIVYQHHERFDGSGYPEKSKGSDISDGAQIIGICDTFYSVMIRNRKRSILRSVAEVNACKEKDFSARWVDLFNKVIRIQQLAGQI